VRVVLIPLTTKQVKSQQTMQRIQPELKRLQAKYKNDRQKLNEEMMKFYKENKVNPLAGCLPIVLQMPLFIVLYRLILGLSAKPRPRHLPSNSEMFKSLVASGGKMRTFGIDLAAAAKSASGFGKAFPYYILIALVVGTGFYQQRQMTSRMPQNAMNQQMQVVGKVFPAFIGLISYSIPAGVVVYFIVSNFWQIGQQAITFKHFDPPPGSPAAAGGARGKGGEKGDGAGGKGKGSKPPPDKPRPSGAAGGNGRVTKSPGANKPPKGARPAARSSAKPAKGKRPPPAPRPKGLPPSKSKGPGPQGPGGAKDQRRKDT
jgi:YidC/Oxa1 family membrane protein insertase